MGNLNTNITQFSDPGSTAGKESACSTGDQGSIPRLARSPGEGKGNPLRYSCLENLVDREAWWWDVVHKVTRVRCDLVTKPQFADKGKV